MQSRPYYFYALALQDVTDLRGSTHTHFFCDALSAAGAAPAHVSVDGAKQWNAVYLQMGAIHGDADKITIVRIAGEVGK